MLRQLDMRKRFRGNIIGSQFEYTPREPPIPTPSAISGTDMDVEGSAT